MTCIVTTFTVIAVGTQLTGCTPNVPPTAQDLALRGYWYHDANHQGGARGETTPQADYNATHGIWLWPPAENDTPPD
jgi:hypothetical protein